MTPFAIRYRTAAPLTPEARERVRAALVRFAGGSAWALCDAPTLAADSAGRLSGSSAVKLTPDPAEVRAAMAVCGPDGTAETLVEVLDQVGRECGVDWELSSTGGLAGVIRNGVADAGVRALLDAASDLSDALMPEGAGDPPAES